MNAVYSRRRWAFRMLDRVSEPIPTYGSAEWLALPEGDLRKVNAVIRAAETWARQGDELEDNLRLEVALARRAFKADEDGDYQARVAAHRQEWGNLRLIKGAYADSPDFRGEAS